MDFRMIVVSASCRRREIPYRIRLMLIRYHRLAVTVESGAATLAGPERLPVGNASGDLRDRIHRRSTSSTIEGQRAAKDRLQSTVPPKRLRRYRHPNLISIEGHSTRASNRYHDFISVFERTGPTFHTAGPVAVPSPNPVSN
jgi:hypothetical protein